MSSKQVLILTGKMGSGKSLITRALVKNFGYMKIKKITDRPKRVGEVGDSDYLFCSPKNLIDFKSKNKILTHEKFDTVHGVFNYMIHANWDDAWDGVSKIVVDLPPSEIDNFKKSLSTEDDVFVLEIITFDDERIKKLLKRGDNTTEVCRRWLADIEDFKELKPDCKLFNSFTSPIKFVEMVDKIFTERC